ncbi:MAG: MotA/TolQ/ExbB proton channel family protein [Deltaproteobacteria bacterium]
MFDSETLLDLIQQGYYATYPLLACSVLALAVAGDRLWALRGLDERMGDLARQVGLLLQHGDAEGATALIQRDGADLPLGRIYLSLIPRIADTSVDDMLVLADGFRMEQAQALRRNVWVLGTVGSAAPFIGLFGTVVGIMRAFHQMAIAGAGGFAVVASGISEALVATALGLAVAIISVVLYNFFQVRLSELATSMQVGIVRFIEALCAARGRSGGRPVA